MTVLVLNCGSSSLKFALVDPERGATLATGLGQRLEAPQASLSWQIAGRKESRDLPNADHAVVIAAVVELLRQRDLIAGVRAVGHRVVHGGRQFSQSVVLDDGALERIAACNHLGPLHNPANLLGIRLCQRLLPGLPQVGVFDTAFHQAMPERAWRYPVPADWYDHHDVRRYGFHGTSHRFVAAEAARRLGRPAAELHLITAHLGNGCSAAAVRGGISVDTTMGMTPLEGLVMGTRSGDIDPALIDYMAGRLKTDAHGVVEILNKRSGLIGISGVSNDMRTLAAAAAAGDRKADLAIEIFCYRLAKAVGALCAGLDRLDALIFTGGIGENSAPVRERTAGFLRVLGITLDPQANAEHGRSANGRISPAGTTPQVLVVPTDEELMIARDTAELVAGATA